MRKSKINICEFVARNDYMDNLEENLMEQVNSLESNNVEVKNVDIFFF